MCKLVSDLGGGKFGYDIEKFPTATSYDYKLWYRLDAQGREVIVGWNKARTDADSLQKGRSQTVLAREEVASINGTKMKAGVYIGQLTNDNFLAGMQLAASETGLAGGSLNATSTCSGHFTESRLKCSTA